MKTELSQQNFRGLYHPSCPLPDWPGQNKSDIGIYSIVATNTSSDQWITNQWTSEALKYTIEILAEKWGSIHLKGVVLPV